ncbi:general transcription factor II-I repeat domain-containing protein 2A-like [Calliopsis andreniformis]|uniref:general transcription factor II-I repeat domain-containing protein 2A-like n=1 Tax=Calliopsis andreniformis TaxID=337506 RepID=UPI003FCE8A69
MCEKFELIEGLKLVNTENPSYAISLLIAKKGKPFTEGDFVKKCLTEAVSAFGNSISFEEAASIPLSDKTVASRISDISLSIEEKLSALLNTCRYFSVRLHESTDNRHISQLSIFARIVQSDFSYVEELLDFVPLHGTTTGVDLFSAVENTLRKFRTDFSKCSAVLTDGAKTMTGTKIGLYGQFKNRDFKFPMIHCIIHQEALCGKEIKLSFAMELVTKIINSIKGGNKFLSHRKFIEFLETHNAVYTDVPLHCEVRWLSAAKSLTKFFAMRKEIFLFLQENPSINSVEYSSLLTDVSFLCELSFVVDLTSHLNRLNLKLQKPTERISELYSHVDSFRRRLTVFQHHLEEKNCFFFLTSKLIFEEFGDECDFADHFHILRSVIDQFNKRFTDFDSLKNDLILLENPLTVRIEEQDLEYQEELCDLQHDISLKTRQETGAEFFKILDESTYPCLKNFAFRLLSMFGSTYLCECSFSKMRSVKTEQRTLLNDSSLSSLMRTATSRLPIDISSLPSTSKRARKSSFTKP